MARRKRCEHWRGLVSQVRDSAAVKSWLENPKPVNRARSPLRPLYVNLKMNIMRFSNKPYVDWPKASMYSSYRCSSSDFSPRGAKVESFQLSMSRNGKNATHQFWPEQRDLQLQFDARKLSGSLSGSQTFHRRWGFRTLLTRRIFNILHRLDQ